LRWKGVSTLSQADAAELRAALAAKLEAAPARVEDVELLVCFMSTSCQREVIRYERSIPCEQSLLMHMEDRSVSS